MVNTMTEKKDKSTFFLNFFKKEKPPNQDNQA